MGRVSKNNGSRGSGFEPIVTAINEMRKELSSKLDQTNERLDQLGDKVDQNAEKTNERLDQLGEKIDLNAEKTNARLDELILNTGSHWRNLEQRVTAIEQRLATR